MFHRFTGIIKKYPLRFLLLISAIQGLIYVFLVPPWQHYDEPGHFEYAWLAANQSQWPQEGDFNLEMRREVAASMIENGFYRGIGGQPDLSSSELPSIGISQIRHNPLYYFLASIPLRFFHDTDITIQLYLVRLVSWVLFLLTVLFLYKTCCELFPKGNPVRWMAPLFVSFLPPFVDLMTAANNDVAAIAFTTFFFWGSIRLLIRGLSLLNILWVIFASVLCILSKTTAFIVVPLGFVALFLAIMKKRQKLAWALLVGIAVISFIALFSLNTSIPAFFYSTNDLFIPKSVKVPEVPVGKSAMVQYSQDHYWDGFFFIIPPSELKQLKGKTVTLGVWAWASKPINVESPGIQIYRKTLLNIRNIHLDNSPRFFAFTVMIPEDATLGWITVFTSDQPGINLYWDSWVLTEGNFSEASPPTFSDPEADHGIWNNVQFRNVIRNGSGEITWPILHPFISQFLEEKIGLTSSYLWSWLDGSNVGWYYLSAAQQIFRSFWGKFGWSQVTLTGSKPFRVFLGLFFLSIIGLAINSKRMARQINWTTAIFLGMAFFFELGIVMLRGVGSWLTTIFLPGSRYLYPVILPIVIFLCGGWYSIAVQFPNKPRLKVGLGFLFVTLLVAYDIWAISSILQFFRGNI